MRSLPGAVALLCLALAGCDSVQARLVAREAADLYRAGDVAQAARRYEEAVRLEPRHPTLQLDLGLASLARFQRDPASADGQAAGAQAAEAFARYLELRPGDERARIWLVQTFVDTNRYDEAVAFFGAAAEREPPDPEALATLASIAARAGRFSEARAWHHRRVAAAPGDAEARVALAVLLWDHLRAHPEVPGAERLALADEAISHLREASRLKPSWPDALSYQSLVYRERALGEGTDEARRADLERAAALFASAGELETALSASPAGGP